MPFDPNQRQTAMAGMARAPISSAPQGIFGSEEDKSKNVDSEESLMRELQDLEKAKLDGSMQEPDYLKNLHSLQLRWEKITPKPYFSKEEGSAGPFTPQPNSGPPNWTK
jgi:hypothetical protein